MKSKCSQLLPITVAALLLLSSFAAQSTSAFVSVQKQQQHQHQHHRPNQQQQLSQRNNIHILNIRGGAIVNNNNNNMSSSTSLASAIHPLTSTLRQALTSGTAMHGIGALYAVSCLTVVPLTWYRTAYSFSVGYGLAIATMALALLGSFPVITITTAATTTTSTSFMTLAKKVAVAVAGADPSLIATITALLYGLRLSLFIYIRENTVESKRQQFEAMNKTPVLKRTPLAMGVSLLYAFMMSPVLFALRSASSTGSIIETGSMKHTIQWVSVGVATFGMLLESIADQHKYQVKRQQNKAKQETKVFVGPTTWSYKLCRHPNYLGEILHWIGLFGVGSISLGKSPVAWVSSLLGLYGILNIMFGASSRLDKKQNEMYSGQSVYEEWKTKVTSSLIPFIK